MKHKLAIILVVALATLLILAGGVTAQGLAPDVPNAPLGTGFTYQGRLKDAGEPVNMTCDFLFTLFGSMDGTDQIGVTEERISVLVNDGYFTMPNLDYGSVFSGESRYLEIAVRCPSGDGAFETLSPRQELTAVPYAIYAYNARNTWQLDGNTGTSIGVHFLGTTDSQPLELRTDNTHALRLEPGIETPNLIGGFSGNYVDEGVSGGTIGGGGSPNNDGEYAPNKVTDDYGTIGGGGNNLVGSNDENATNDPYGTIAGGLANSVSGQYATIGGGWSNESVSYGAVIGGGINNTASDSAATISGGSANTASGPGSFVGGGAWNAANGEFGTVGGGNNNIANNMNSTVGGGYANFAYGDSSTITGGYDNWVYSGSTNGTISGGSENLVTDEGGMVGGGYDNQAGNNTGSSNDANYAFVGGGYGNTGSAHNAVVAGGYDNTASGGYSFIGGGDTNTTNGGYGSIGGGRYNQAAGLSAIVGGGDHNQALANYATVGGGGYNTASGLGSVVAGGGGISEGWTYTNTASGPWSTVSGGVINTAGGSSSSIGGGEDNSASSWASTVAGGSSNVASGLDSAVGGGANNIASGHSSTVGGGWTNRAEASASTVSGGENNTASGEDSAVGGGILNKSVGSYAAIPGGHSNEAYGNYSFAAGRNAWIASGGTGSFVWSDSNPFLTRSWGPNEFVARATGGFWLISGIDGVGSITSGAKLDANDSQWKTLSDRDMKTSFTIVNGEDVLERLAGISIQTWQYKAQTDEALHMGPMAQDFYSAFGLGKDDKYIGTMDLDGVALASIQGLYAISQDQADQIESLQVENAFLRQQLGGSFHGGMPQSLSILVYVLAGTVLLLMVGLIWVLFRLRSLRPLEDPNVK